MRKIINKLFIGSLIALSLFNTNSVRAQDVKDLDINSIKFPPLHDVAVPEVKKVTLKNGMRLYLLEDHSLPLLDVSVRINIGSYLEPKNQIGLSDIVGDLLKECGTEKYAPDDLDELIDSLSASIGNYGDVTFHHVDLNMLSSQKELAIELLDQIIRHPRFDQERLDQAMIGYKSSIARRNDNPSSVASREFKKMIYGKDSVDYLL